MRKREKEAMLRRFSRLEAKIAKKRDEMRALIEDFEPLIDSVREATDDADCAVDRLLDAKRSFEDAVDKASQFV